MPASSEVSLLFEAVLPPELLQKHRFTPEQARTDEFSYIPDPQLLLDQPLAPLPLAKVVSQAAQQQHRPIRLCFVGMLKMDGQKKDTNPQPEDRSRRWEDGPRWTARK